MTGFCRCAWSPDESSLVVVAEAPRDAPTRGYFAEGEGEAEGKSDVHGCEPFPREVGKLARW